MSARGVRLGDEELIPSITRHIGDWKRGELERESLRAQLHPAAKMEAVGQLAGGVAHDFNNLLTVILSCAGALQQDRAEGRADGAEELDAIQAAGERARDLTRQLLTFARRQVIAPEPLDVGQVVRGCEKLLRRLLREDVELVVGFEPALWPVRRDRGQVEQIVMNLAVNSRDAMPSGGTLEVRTSNLVTGDEAGAAWG
jgi:signal transduction histidine kinase